jgi:hypothetical protein
MNSFILFFVYHREKPRAHNGHFSGRIIFETAQQGQSHTSTNAQNKGKDK